MYILNSIDSPESSNIQAQSISNVDNLLDSNPDTYATITANNARLTLDFGSTVSIGLMRLKSGVAHNLQSIVVTSSENGVSFTNSFTRTISNKVWQVIPFENYNRQHWRIEFIRTTSSNYSLFEIDFYEVLADFTANEDHPYKFDPSFINLEGKAEVKAKLAFEWHYLKQELVEKLEDIFFITSGVIILPNSVDKADQIYTAVWSSVFDFYDTRPTDWTQGKSGAVIFQEI